MNNITNNHKTENLNRTTTPAPAQPLGSIQELDGPAAGNDNAASGGIPDTTALVAHRQVVQAIRATFRRYRVPAQDMADAIADVQVEAIEMARTRAMPQSVAQWKALAIAVAAHWAVDRLRRTRHRGKHDAGPCEDADAFMSPTLYWEHRDPVDTKRYLIVLKDLFESGQMPERGEEILQGVADRVPHEEIAAEIGVTPSIVRGRLFRMRATFRTKLAALGMLILVLLLGALFSPVGEVAAPAPGTTTASPALAVNGRVPVLDGGEGGARENRPHTSNEIAP